MNKDLNSTVMHAEKCNETYGSGMKWKQPRKNIYGH